MILVQRRNELFDAIIRELKRAGVPVAGADLLRIGGELAVNDLLAALRFAATPGDDLSLAALLRSPLGGLTERELFELAHPRDGHALARRCAPSPPRWPEVRALLADLRARADFLRPFELLARILVRHDGRRKLDRPPRARGRGRHRRAHRPGPLVPTHAVAVATGSDDP